MKRLYFIVLMAVAISMAACSSVGEKSKESYPMFWTWLDYKPEANFDSICNIMKESGIDGLMLNAATPDDYRKTIPIANKHGIVVYAWMWSINPEHDSDKLVEEHPDWFSVNRIGESTANSKVYVDYYKFMCPALPEVREYLKAKAAALCEVEGLEGIAIDYHRFVDVILPTSLWPRYDVIQDREYPEFDFGYHPAMIEIFKKEYGYDPREQEDPSKDEKRLQFRCDQITLAANEMADVIHSYGKKIGASPFPTPNMSRKMVRQDWGKWNLDIVFPMVYHNFYTGDVSFISDCTLDNMEQKNPMTTLYCGMTATNGPQMFECMDAALNNGAQGIAIFTVEGLRTPQIRAQFKTYADSMRNLRATKGLNYDSSKKPIVDPFQNSGIMEILDMRMKASLSLARAAKSKELKDHSWQEIQKMGYNAVREVYSTENYLRRLRQGVIAECFKEDVDKIKLDLSEYKLVDEYGVTKCYQVTEKNSGVVFDVVFYFYGGVISGWSLMPEQQSYDNYYKSI